MPAAFGAGRLSILTLTCALAVACGNSPSAPSPPPTPAAPAITCPAPIVLSNVLGSARAVDFPPPIVTGGAQPVQVSCTPPTGSQFSFGTTTVQCLAVDRLNRQASCVFPVTLEAQPLDVMRFLAFGDSVTAGEDGTTADLRLATIDPAASYPTALRRALTADFPDQDVVVINRGVGGEPASCEQSPTFCGAGRLLGELLEFRPDVVLLLHGYNDLLADGVDAVDAVVDALRDMMRKGAEAEIRYVFVGAITPGRTAVGPRDRQIDPAAITQANAELSAIAPMEGAFFVDLHAAFVGREIDLIEDDGLHPTQLGNAVIAETFYARISEVLRVQEASPVPASVRHRRSR